MGGDVEGLSSWTAEPCEPRQSRKAAALSGKLRVLRECLDLSHQACETPWSGTKRVHGLSLCAVVL